MLAGEKGEGEEYGIAAKEQFSLLEVANLFGGEVVMLPATKSTRSSAGDVDTSALEALGWKQRKTLKEYIEETKRNG